MARKKTAVRRRGKAAPASIGLSPAEMRKADDSLTPLMHSIERDGGSVLGSYREPFGGHALILAALPVDRVEPTPYQRDPSDPHVKRLMTVIESVGHFLDPIIAVPAADGFWTPNGNHRLQALRRLGVRSITALVVPDTGIAFKILALNTEKAHNIREKSLEAIRMLRAIAEEQRDAIESTFAFEFEQPAFLTLGAAYEERPRLSGGAYLSVLRRVDDFLEQPAREAARERQRRGRLVLRVDDGVGAVIEKLKARGFTSPYLKPFVIARVNPIRFSKSTEFEFDDVLERMRANTGKFKVERVKPEEIARAGGPGGEEE